MPHPADLAAHQAEKLITALRTGQPLDEAAAALRLDMATVWTTARTHTRLAIALAGRDPDAKIEQARAGRADFLRLLALGLPAAKAELAVGGGIGTWRDSDPAYAQACTMVSQAAVSYTNRGSRKMTPKVTAAFLNKLRVPRTTVRQAAAAAGVTNTAVYQRRRRDEVFANAMKEAQAEARSASGR